MCPPYGPIIVRQPLLLLKIRLLCLDIRHKSAYKFAIKSDSGLLVQTVRPIPQTVQSN